MSLFYSEMSSPVGELTLVSDGSALVAILWQSQKRTLKRLGEVVHLPSDPVLQDARQQLEEYFAGHRKSFDLPLRPQGTVFQKQVWRGLCQIPFGSCRSYADLARAIGKPGAARAVGAATGRNPLCIVVPCHRLIGQDGSLTGFAGGLRAKAALIAHEKAPWLRRLA